VKQYHNIGGRALYRIAVYDSGSGQVSRFVGDAENIIAIFVKGIGMDIN